MNQKSFQKKNNLNAIKVAKVKYILISLIENLKKL